MAQIENESKRQRKTRWDIVSTEETTNNDNNITNNNNTTHLQPTQSQLNTIKQIQQNINLNTSNNINNINNSNNSNQVISIPLGGDTRIYVGSLNYDIKEAEIRVLFSSFGNIRSIDMSQEPGTGRSKGFCFIEYETAAAAEAAQIMNNFELAGRNIKVGRPHTAAAPITAPQSVLTSIPPIVAGMTPKQQAYIILAHSFIGSGVNPPPGVLQFIHQPKTI